VLLVHAEASGLQGTFGIVQGIFGVIQGTFYNTANGTMEYKHSTAQHGRV
jgi:hypothetical protein